jgi:hypothetical protein
LVETQFGQSSVTGGTFVSINHPRGSSRRPWLAARLDRTRSRKLITQAFGELSEKRRNQPLRNHPAAFVITLKSGAELDFNVNSFASGSGFAAKKETKEIWTG